MKYFLHYLLPESINSHKTPINILYEREQSKGFGLNTTLNSITDE